MFSMMRKDSPRKMEEKWYVYYEIRLGNFAVSKESYEDILGGREPSLTDHLASRETIEQLAEAIAEKIKDYCPKCYTPNIRILNQLPPDKPQGILIYTPGNSSCGDRHADIDLNIIRNLTLEEYENLVKNLGKCF